MRTKLMAALFSAAIFSAGSASAATENFPYSYAYQGKSNYQFVTGEINFYDNGKFITLGDMQAEGVWEDAWKWVKKYFPLARKVGTIAELIMEVGMPAFHYISDHLAESEITANCNWFYEDYDYWNGDMTDEEKFEYEGSANYDDHEQLSDEEWWALKDFCYEHRPR